MSSFQSFHLGLDVANRMCDAAISACIRNSFVPVTIVICDASAIPIVTKRMDGCAPVGIPQFAMAKAYTCIAMKMSSRMFRDKYTETNEPAKYMQMASMVNITHGQMAPFPGGVLLKLANGSVVGAIGVSGATSDQDEFLALQAAQVAFSEPGVAGTLLSDPANHRLEGAR
mmetsp:Transcript_23234/g.33275  ORF Transcript_23234/g.33275 Transcript_23234/m.33275 type:complete len:171 (-) Transcript_23234:121-633(-)|eukprot:CAMPEP_0201105272 /NCGR_PEP_ID=MMETSP0812-20130820/44613_1 /ASSEMBLY_ACC=CAM_ASM_000668 /TAXON_ID=98059 /ORGANISM="Dinobryon sp., Strain UTEXLB2267" /LENGTH=170 /DNA_ID=CAMNT_0047364963 /DNA_START=1 /DNA_END=513 /DNA_ORIENTATION=+